MTPRFKVYDNEEGTVIEIDGYPIQSSIVFTDVQIAKYLTSRTEREAECKRTTEAMWTLAD